MRWWRVPVRSGAPPLKYLGEPALGSRGGRRFSPALPRDLLSVVSLSSSIVYEGTLVNSEGFDKEEAARGLWDGRYLWRFGGVARGDIERAQ